MHPPQNEQLVAVCAQDVATVAAAADNEDARSEEGRAADADRADGGDEPAEAAAGEERGADDGAAQMDVDTEAGPSAVRPLPQCEWW